MKVLIFGSNGQDGSYLSELLLERGDEVIGIVRRSSTPNTNNLEIARSNSNFTLEQGDITDFSSVFSLLNKHRPDWIFNLAAQSHVGTSFNQPLFTTNVTYLGHLNLLEAIRLSNLSPKVYFAGSSEEFGRSYEEDISYYTQIGSLSLVNSNKYQTLNTHKRPSSPYGVAKVAAHNLSEIYRFGYGMDIRVGVLGNHESPRRGEYFVTRKITKYLGELHYCQRNYCNLPSKLKLGNLDICRDWGYSKDYCRCMIKIMEYPESRDWLVGTGETYTIEEFCCTAFKLTNCGSYNNYIIQDESQLRPVEVPYLRMKCDETYKLLNWRPKTTFNELVKMMVNYDIEAYRKTKTT